MSRLLGFYETQLRVLWEWRGGRVALLKRLLITLVVATVSFLATAAIFGSRFSVDRVIDGVIAVILIVAVQRRHPAGHPGARRPLSR